MKKMDEPGGSTAFTTDVDSFERLGFKIWLNLRLQVRDGDSTLSIHCNVFSTQQMLIRPDRGLRFKIGDEWIRLDARVFRNQVPTGWYENALYQVDAQLILRLIEAEEVRYKINGEVAQVTGVLDEWVLACFELFYDTNLERSPTDGAQ